MFKTSLKRKKFKSSLKRKNVVQSYKNVVSYCRKWVQ